MSHSCAQWRGDIGAYLAGALDGRARDRVASHFPACAGCQADYDELVPIRDWLGLLTLLAGGLEGSCRESGDHRPAQPPHKRPGARKQARRWLPAAGIATTAAAAVVALLVSSSVSARTFRAADTAPGVSGDAQLHDTPAGTQIDLTATGLPAHERCILVAVTPGGTDIAGSWDATYNGSARIAGTTAFPARQLTALRLETDTGILLLSIRV